MIENTKKRKELFLQIVLPLILQENNNIKLDRKRLFSIINKSNNTELEKKWLNKKYQTIWHSIKRSYQFSKVRMDEDSSIISSCTSGKRNRLGNFKICQEGNALFGQWTWSGEGLKPKEAEEG